MYTSKPSCDMIDHVSVRREINYVVISSALIRDRDWSISRHVACGRI